MKANLKFFILTVSNIFTKLCTDLREVPLTKDAKLRLRFPASGLSSKIVSGSSTRDDNDKDRFENILRFLARLLASRKLFSSFPRRAKILRHFEAII